MIQRALTFSGIMAGVLAGLTQAYPGLFPGGEFYLGWAAIILGISSLVVPAVIRRVKSTQLSLLVGRIIAETPAGQNVEINATFGDVRSQAVARYLENAFKEKGSNVRFQFQMHSLPQDGIKCSSEEARTVIDVGRLDSAF